MKTRDYSVEIANLEKLINNVQSSVYFTITIIVAVCALAIALYGWSLKILAKHWVNERVSSELEIIDKRVKVLIEENRQFNSAHGNVSIQKDKIVQVIGFLNLTKDNFISLSVMDHEGRIINYKNLMINNGGFTAEIDENSLNYYAVSWFILWRRDV
jgi:hypothetical protein